jgi:hypothetical protein
MKKVMFTAIALIAFSSVSMGNTIADEETINENINTFELKQSEVLQKGNIDLPWEFIQTIIECVGVYNEIKASYTEVLGSQQATAIAQGAFVGCLGGI